MHDSTTAPAADRDRLLADLIEHDPVNTRDDAPAYPAGPLSRRVREFRRAGVAIASTPFADRTAYDLTPPPHAARADLDALARRLRGRAALHLRTAAKADDARASGFIAGVARSHRSGAEAAKRVVARHPAAAAFASVFRPAVNRPAPRRPASPRLRMLLQTTTLVGGVVSALSARA